MNTVPSIATSKVTQFSLWKTITLHLLPGVLIAAVYSLLVRTVSASGYPRVIALTLAAIIVLLPFVFGYILYRSKKELGTFSLWKMIPYREKVSLKDYIVFVPLLFIWFGLMFTVTKSLNNVLLNKVFYWIPNWYLLNENFTTFGRSALIVTFLSSSLLTGLLMPAVEEIYFRGFLLPRMSSMGKYAPLVNAVLFSVYHFWSPWQAVTRILAITPMAYVVNRTKNIRIGIITHCMLNILGDAVGIFVLILRLQ